MAKRLNKSDRATRDELVAKLYARGESLREIAASPLGLSSISGVRAALRRAGVMLRPVGYGGRKVSFVRNSTSTAGPR